MNVTLLGHTQLAKTLTYDFDDYEFTCVGQVLASPSLEGVTDGQVVALAAIRQCYSHKTAEEVLISESEKYFGDKGQEGKRLFNHIVKSGHTSTLEHINFTFAIEGVSRSLLAQLTRHRHMSFSVQSQRYVKLSSESRSGGFEYAVPETVRDESKKAKLNNLTETAPSFTALEYFEDCMVELQHCYDKLIECGVPQEDARAVLPNATTCNLVMSANLRTLLDFYSKRKPGNGAQHEITLLAEELKNRVVEVEPWTEEYFNL